MMQSGSQKVCLWRLPMTQLRSSLHTFALLKSCHKPQPPPMHDFARLDIEKLANALDRLVPVTAEQRDAIYGGDGVPERFSIPMWMILQPQICKRASSGKWRRYTEK